MFSKGLVAILTGAVATAAGLSAPAHAQNCVQVGTLTCSVSAGIGLIVASQRNVNCIFKPDGGPPESILAR